MPERKAIFNFLDEDISDVLDYTRQTNPATPRVPLSLGDLKKLRGKTVYVDLNKDEKDIPDPKESVDEFDCRFGWKNPIYFTTLNNYLKSVK